MMLCAKKLIDFITSDKIEAFNIRFNRDHSLYRLVSLLLFDLYRPFILSNMLIVLTIAALPPFRSIF